jgi:hypothetical protein
MEIVCMSDLELIDAVAHVTGEDSHEIRRRGFTLTGPEDSGSDLDPECLLDVLLVDLPETGTVDWDAVLGDGGFRSPFYTRAQQARRKAKADVRASTTKQAARAA